MIGAIYAYDNNSASARSLSQRLGVPLIRHQGSRFKGREDKTVLNWGSTYHNIPAEVLKCRVINRKGSINKLDFMKEVSPHAQTPPWTVEREKAYGWLLNGSTVVLRHDLWGYGGRGIEIIDNPNEHFPLAPLYTFYIPKKEEYRIHLRKGTPDTFTECIAATRKAGVPGIQKNWKIRNLENGFVYELVDFYKLPWCVQRESIGAFLRLDYDFAALDVIWNKKNDEAYVLEANTAPGFEPRTLDMYVDYLQRNF